MLNFIKKPLYLTPFWQNVKAKAEIKELSGQIGEIEENLKSRSDQEFLAYSLNKLLIITKAQNQLLQKKY